MALYFLGFRGLCSSCLSLALKEALPEKTPLKGKGALTASAWVAWIPAEPGSEGVVAGWKEGVRGSPELQWGSEGDVRFGLSKNPRKLIREVSFKLGNGTRGVTTQSPPRRTIWTRGQAEGIYEQFRVLMIIRHHMFSFQNWHCFCNLKGPKDLLYSKGEPIGFWGLSENQLLSRGKKNTSPTEKIIKRRQK